MPNNPSYLHRLTAILAEARSPKPIPFFRRCDIEALFGLKRRQAIDAIRASKADEETELWLRRLRDEAYVEYKL